MSETARSFLESLQRFDLSMLLSECATEIAQGEVDNGFFEEWVTSAVVDAPPPIDDALKALPPQERKRIAEAVASAYPNVAAPADIVVRTTNAARTGGSPGLLAELLIHRAMMISVATGGDRIQDVDDYYRAREARIRQSLPDGVAYENPHADLWSWYRYWDAHFAKWAERRNYVRELFAPAIDAVAKRSSMAIKDREPTGWERVDRTLSKARHQFDLGSVEEDYQAIGLLCREIIISLAQAVYDPAIHSPVDGVQPSPTDANRMLEAYFAHVFPGESYKEVRAHARASLALALNLQHRRTATRQLAALCLEGTASTAAVVSIIARPPAE